MMRLNVPAGTEQAQTFLIQIVALGYTRAGESLTCPEDEREATFGRGPWKAATPLFTFMIARLPLTAAAHVTQTSVGLDGSAGLDRVQHCIAKSSADFERLHEHMQAQVGAGANLPKLPGRKRLNANAHSHLQKRVRRYAEYLSLLVQIPAASGAAALESFFAAGELWHPWHIPAHYIITGAEAHPLTRKTPDMLQASGKMLQEPRATSDKVSDDEEVSRLRELLTQQQRSQKSMMQQLLRVMLETFLDASHTEKYRALLEQFLLQKSKPLAVENGIWGMMLRVPKVTLPTSSESTPELTLKSFDNTSGSSIWSIRVTPGQVFSVASKPISVAYPSL
jgi:hypothetical protein